MGAVASMRHVAVPRVNSAQKGSCQQKFFNFRENSEKGMAAAAFDAVRIETGEEREGDGRSKRTLNEANERATMMGLSERASERGERVSHATKRTGGEGVRAAERR